MSLTTNQSVADRNAVTTVEKQSAPRAAAAGNTAMSDPSEVLCSPVLAHNRYGREDFLALRPKLDPEPPEDLVQRFDELFVPLQQPATLSPFSDVEKRLLMGGINSSKVISAVNHVEKDRTARWQAGVRGAGPLRPNADVPPRGAFANRYGRGGGKLEWRDRSSATGYPSGSDAAEEEFDERLNSRFKDQRGFGGFQGRFGQQRSFDDHRLGHAPAVGGGFSSSAVSTAERRIPESIKESVTALGGTRDMAAAPEPVSFGGGTHVEDSTTISFGSGFRRPEVPAADKAVRWRSSAASDGAYIERESKLTTPSDLLANKPARWRMSDIRAIVDKPETSASSPAVPSKIGGQLLNDRRIADQDFSSPWSVAPSSSVAFESVIPSLASTLARTSLSSEGQPQSFSRMLEVRENESAPAADWTSDVCSSTRIGNRTKTVSASPGEDQWLYLDPQNQVQGPFPGRQMAAWFASGYFDLALRLRRVCDASFSSLGDYMTRFGRVPFVSRGEAATVSPSVPLPTATMASLSSMYQPDSRPEAAVASVTGGFPVAHSPSQNISTFDTVLPSTTGFTGYASQGVEPKVCQPTPSVVQTTGSAAAATAALISAPVATAETIRAKEVEERIRKQLIEEQNRVKQLEEKIARDREEQEKIKKELERQLKEARQKKEEIEAAAREQRIRSERQKREEEQQQRDFDNKSEEVEPWKKAKESGKAKVKAAPETTGRKGKKDKASLSAPAAAEKKTPPKGSAVTETLGEEWEKLEDFKPENDFVEVQKKRPDRTKTKRGGAKPQPAPDTRAEADAAGQKPAEGDVYSVWNKTADQWPDQSGGDHETDRDVAQRVTTMGFRPASVRDAVWIATFNKDFTEDDVSKGGAWGNRWLPSAAARQTKTMSLRDIQAEEERQIKAELRQNMEMVNRRRQQTAPAFSSSVWNMDWAPAKLSHSAESQFVTAAQREIKADSEAQRSTKKGWQKDSEKASFLIDRTARDIRPKNETVSPFGNSKKLSDEFVNWCIKTVESLTREVDAPSFVGLLNEFQSMNDVEEYVLMYLGDTPQSRNFVQMYASKLSSCTADEVDQQPKSDELAKTNAFCQLKEEEAKSAGAVSTPEAASAGAAPTGGKKKGFKKSKLKPVDTDVLGFTAVGDPNRVNAGEIESYDF